MCHNYWALVENKCYLFLPTCCFLSERYCKGHYWLRKRSVFFGGFRILWGKFLTSFFFIKSCFGATSLSRSWNMESLCLRNGWKPRCVYFQKKAPLDKVRQLPLKEHKCLFNELTYQYYSEMWLPWENGNRNFYFSLEKMLECKTSRFSFLERDIPKKRMFGGRCNKFRESYGIFP